MEISEVTDATEVTDEIVSAIARLADQLSPACMPPTREEVADMIAKRHVVLWMARESSNGAVVGMVTLVVYRCPTGLRAQIEDVVVDQSARGRGIGEAMLRVALDRAADDGAAHVDLTSRPTRQSARRLYGRLGFVQRDTAVYRFQLND